MGEPREGGSAPPDPDGFRDDAAAAGLVLPTRKRVDPWLAVGVSVLILLAAVGIGYSTGWLDPAAKSHGFSHPSSCSTPVAELSGSIDSLATPLLNATFANLTANYTRSSGGCIAFHLSPASGDGAVGALADRSSDFVLLSAPLSPAQAALLPMPVYLVPVLLGSVSVVYHLPGLGSGLNLTPAALAGIYLGTVTAWNASAIAGANPGTDLSGAPAITAVHDPGASGVNAVFTQYLASVNAAWAGSVGAGASVAWPTGASVPGTLAYVAATPGAIGFVEGNVPATAGVGVANLENAAGNFTGPTDPALTAAASAAGTEGNGSAAAHLDWGNVSLATAGGNASYPLAEFGYAGVYEDIGKAYGGSLSDYDAWWLLTFFESIVYANGTAGSAPLPTNLVNLDASALAEVAYDGTSILVGPSDGTDTDPGGTETGGETGAF